MEELTAFTDFVQTVGFPIAMCLAMFWYINRQGESHKAEIDKLSEAVTNNTLIMEKLYDRLTQGRD